MGYPGQPPQQGWPGGYPPPYGPPQGQGSPALAVIAGILGLAIAGMLGFATIDLLGDIPEQAELPGGWVVMFVLHFLIVALGLLGAILVFARQIVGAFVLLAVGVLTVAAILVDPVMAEGLWYFLVGAMPEIDATGEYGAYLEAMFEFGNEQAVLFALSLVVGALLTLLAALPPSLRWLRGSRLQHGYGQYPPSW